jgi:hypothetical protein
MGAQPGHQRVLDVRGQIASVAHRITRVRTRHREHRRLMPRVVEVGPHDLYRAHLSAGGPSEAPPMALLGQTPDASGRRLVAQRELWQREVVGEVLEHHAHARADGHLGLVLHGEIRLHEVGDDP